MTTKEGMTVKQLCSTLLDLIEDGYSEHTIDLSVNYDNCNHIQPLREVYAPKKDTGIDWIVLLGAKE